MLAGRLHSNATRMLAAVNGLAAGASNGEQYAAINGRPGQQWTGRAGVG